jgi:signal transduction histidine kinase
MDRSPTPRLLLGLAVTLLAAGIFSWYSLRQIDVLRGLHTETIDRNRKDSLQLLRIQNDLNSLGLAIRDIVDAHEPYPLEAYRAEFDRIRNDLKDALRIEGRLASRSKEQQDYLERASAQLWLSSEQIFSIAQSGDQERARRIAANSLQAQQSALSAAVARLLVQNNEAEQGAFGEIQRIHDRVERNIYVFLGAMLAAICAIGLSVIYLNRRVFHRLAGLSEQRSTLARKLIGVQEEVFRSVSRELHDEFGQILTAIGAMLTRAERKGLPSGSPFHADMSEIKEVVQATLDKTRSFSQALHPAILDDHGLERALEKYVPSFEKQTGIRVAFEKSGAGELQGDRAIHVYRVLQEALNNVARHSMANAARVRLSFQQGSLRLEVEDSGIGIQNGNDGRGLGLIAMRERAELLQGSLQLLRLSEGGTRVTLEVPLEGSRA